MVSQWWSRRPPLADHVTQIPTRPFCRIPSRYNTVNKAAHEAMMTTEVERRSDLPHNTTHPIHVVAGCMPVVSVEMTDRVITGLSCIWGNKTLLLQSGSSWKMPVLYLPVTLPVTSVYRHSPWLRHQMETFSALLALCAGNSPVTGEFPSKRPEKARDAELWCFHLLLNKWVGTQSRRRWFKTPSRSLWRQCNVTLPLYLLSPLPLPFLSLFLYLSLSLSIYIYIYTFECQGLQPVYIIFGYYAHMYVYVYICS